MSNEDTFFVKVTQHRVTQKKKKKKKEIIFTIYNGHILLSQWNYTETVRLVEEMQFWNMPTNPSNQALYFHTVKVK